MRKAIARTFYRFVRITSLPVTLGLPNIYILPTRYGVLFLVVLGAMLSGSINYNNNLGFLLTFLLGSLALTAMMHTYSMLYGLRLTSARAAPVFAGETLAVQIVVDGGGRQRVGLVWSFENQAAASVDVGPERAKPLTVPVATKRRGRLEPGWLRVRCEYPLGLFRAWARVQTGLSCMVYPQPLPTTMPVARGHAGRGEGRAQSGSGVEDFMGLRAYRPGDPPRRIVWQAFSKGRGLHVKSFGGQAGADWLLDLAAVKARGLERKLSILCYQVLQGERMQCRVGLTLGGQSIGAGRGKQHRDHCLQALALYPEAR